MINPEIFMKVRNIYMTVLVAKNKLAGHLTRPAADNLSKCTNSESTPGLKVDLALWDSAKSTVRYPEIFPCMKSLHLRIW
jgi:hypothetical protein